MRTVPTRYESPDETKPHVVVRHISRNTYLVYVATNRGTRYGPDGYGWHRRTQAAAIRKGERELARYNRKYGELDKELKIQ